MHYGKRSSRQRPHDAANSSQAQSGASASRVLASQYGLNVKTVPKWRGRAVTTDAPMGPKPKSTVLSRRSRNQTGKAHPRPCGQILDDPPIHIRPVVPASAGAEGKNSAGSSHYGLPRLAPRIRDRKGFFCRKHQECSDKGLTPAEEAVIVEFRRRTLLPLDDVLDCLKDTIANLSRSALHRCLQRHGISRLLAGETTEKRKRFKTYEIGYVHIDSAELAHADGKLVMFLAIDRVSKFTYVEFHEHAGKIEGTAFLKNVVAAFPYKIHTVLTDNGMAFADLPKNREGPTRRVLGSHIFDRVCLEHGIEHRLTKSYHPWTNGQAERMNRTVKEATVRAFHYDDLVSLKTHVLSFVTAYNFAKPQGTEVENTLPEHL